jgi:hypothetical protein
MRPGASPRIASCGRSTGSTSTDRFSGSTVSWTIRAFAEAPTERIVQEIIERARAFSGDRLRDDVAVVSARFL